MLSKRINNQHHVDLQAMELDFGTQNFPYTDTTLYHKALLFTFPDFLFTLSILFRHLKRQINTVMKHVRQIFCLVSSHFIGINY